MNSLSRRWPDPRSGTSLERRLPLLISILLAAVVSIFCIAAYQEMRSTSLERAAQRLERLSQDLATTISQQNAPRVAALEQLGSTPAVRGVLAAGDSVAAVDHLRASLRPRDSTLIGWEVWTRSGERRLRTAPPATSRDSAMLAIAIESAKSRDSGARSPLYADRDRVFSWIVVPIRVGGRSVAYLAELRHLMRSRRAEVSLRQLTGENVSVYVASRGVDDWATIGGSPAPRSFVPPDSAARATLLRDTTGTKQIVVQAPVAGSPWSVVLAEPEAAVTERPREFLLRMVLFGAALLLLGTFIAWLLSRHVTRPLRDLTEAAEALSSGDHSRRVEARGGAELVRLADTFNVMAGRIGEAHAELGKRNAELQRANQAKSSFLTMMSHELRTPLNAIAGYTELMQLGLRGPVTPQQEEDLVRIRRNKDHLLSIITDILSFARADAGSLMLNIEDVSVRDALRDASEVMAHQFKEKGLSFHVEEVPDTVKARADREKLQQVLLNLLTNALRFTDAGGSVVVSSATTEEKILIRVRDTGIGIPAERLGTIFDPFVQVDASLTRQVGGAGLGLSIARDLTRAMGGTVTVESQPRQGSVFTVALPRPGIQPADTSIGTMHMSRSYNS
jgi:signal transduction histidine kinase